MKIKYIVSAVLALALAALIVIATNCRSSTAGFSMRMGKFNESGIRTDIQPIYNHYPTLPPTDDIQWCSTSLTGQLGLDKYDLYVFAFYEPEELKKALENITYGKIGLLPEYEKMYFVPEILNDKNAVWNRYNQNEQIFQDGLAQEKQLASRYYFELEQGIIYIHASWD